MPTWLKVILGIVAFGFALVVVGIYFAYRWVKTNAPELKQQAQAVAAEGKKFGQGRPGAACIDEAFVRLEREGGFVAEVRHQMFLSSCLDAATPSPELCASVPPRNEIRASVQWSLAECARRGRPNSQPCTRLLGAVQEHCHRSR